MMTAFLVSLIRHDPQRYMVFIEPTEPHSLEYGEHANDDWDAVLVYNTHDEKGRPYLWCLRHEVTEANACGCIIDVKNFRAEAKITDF